LSLCKHFLVKSSTTKIANRQLAIWQQCTQLVKRRDREGHGSRLHQNCVLRLCVQLISACEKESATGRN